MASTLTSPSTSGDTSSENEVFIELQSAKSLSLIEIRKIGESPKYRTRKRRHQLTKIRVVAALSVFTLLVAVSIILYFAVTHITTTEQQSGSTESDAKTTTIAATTTLETTQVSEGISEIPTTTVHTEVQETTTTRADVITFGITNASDSTTKDRDITTAETWRETTTENRAVVSTQQTDKTETTTEGVSTSSDVTTTSDVSTEKSWVGISTEKTETATTAETDKTSIVPVVFIRERLTFPQAAKKCEELGTKLALKEDLQNAYEVGYEKCAYGWLRDTHEGFVMQKSNMRCARGRVGVIYSLSSIDINTIKQGAYCKTEPDKSDPTPPIIQPTAKSVNWWVRLDPADIYHLKDLLGYSWHVPVAKQSPSNDASSPSNLLGSLHAVYPCCNFFNVTWADDGKENRTFVKIKKSLANVKYLAEEYRRQFSDLLVLPHVFASYEAMIMYGAATTNRTEIIDDLVEKAAEANVDGLIMDYEPASEYTREHAEIYRDFVNTLTKKMREHDMEVGMMISGWGILKFYDIYSTVECRMIGSMSNTYTGHDVPRNIENVDQMLLHIATQRLQVGIGSMHDGEAKKLRRDFGWAADELGAFLGHLEKVGVQHLHIFPGQWGAIQWTEEYFVNALLDFAVS